MPIIGPGNSVYYRPRLVPESVAPVAPDTASLINQLGDLQLQSDGVVVPPPIQGTLSLPSLTIAGAASTYRPATPDPVPTAQPAYSGSSGGLGLSAYGVSQSGLASQKGSSPYGFQPQMWDALRAANRAMASDGLGTFGITDGWRSYDAQVAAKRKKGNLAATPGRSVHGIGLAADLNLSSSQLRWLKKNGSRFGLVNLPSESWHWQLNSKLWKGDAGYGVADYGLPEKRGKAPFGLQPKMYDALAQANKDMASEGLGTIGITSGYRSQSEQAALHRKQPSNTAPAGMSTHQQGVAADIDGTPKQLRWLRTNGYKYGLVPSSEPWHFQLSPSLV